MDYRKVFAIVDELIEQKAHIVYTLSPKFMEGKKNTIIYYNRKSKHNYSKILLESIDRKIELKQIPEETYREVTKLYSREYKQKEMEKTNIN